MSVLNPSQRDALKARMLARAAVMREEIAAVARREDASEVDVAGMERDRAELNDIDAALARIDSQQYGSCIDCGMAIPVHRLVIEPQAKRCVRCESEDERRRAQPSPARL